jgi:hypothetical protein
MLQKTKESVEFIPMENLWHLIFRKRKCTSIVLDEHKKEQHILYSVPTLPKGHYIESKVKVTQGHILYRYHEMNSQPL